MITLKLTNLKSSKAISQLLFICQLFSCGNSISPFYDPMSLKHSRAHINQYGNGLLEANIPRKETPTSLCKGFEVPIFEWFMLKEPKGIKLASTSSFTLRSPQLKADASIEERCDEIQKNFSGAFSEFNGGSIRRMTLFLLKFKLTNTEEDQIKSGELIYTYPNKISLDITDGGYLHLNVLVSLSCPRPFEIKCKHGHAINNEKCNYYDINYPDQVCILQTNRFQYFSSNQRSAAIELNGEIRLSKESGSLLVIKEVKW